MRLALTCMALLSLATMAGAQTPSTDAAATATMTADPGRPRPDGRGGLSGRGGPITPSTQATYSATIGSRIYSSIESPIRSQLPSDPR